jgi:hypothetical protein
MEYAFPIRVPITRRGEYLTVAYIINPLAGREPSGNPCFLGLINLNFAREKVKKLDGIIHYISIC